MTWHDDSWRFVTVLRSRRSIPSTPGTPRACSGPCGCRRIDRRVTGERVRVSAPHVGMRRLRRESHRRRGLARSGRVVGSRKSDSSSAAGMVAVASTSKLSSRRGEVYCKPRFFGQKKTKKVFATKKIGDIFRRSFCFFWWRNFFVYITPCHLISGFPRFLWRSPCDIPFLYQSARFSSCSRVSLRECMSGHPVQVGYSGVMRATGVAMRPLGSRVGRVGRYERAAAPHMRVGSRGHGRVISRPTAAAVAHGSRRRH